MTLFSRFKKRKKVFIIGLDCMAPDLVFDKYASYLPNLSYLKENGLWGDLESSIPAITVPAWSCMTTSKDPGELGFYGFRNRKDYSYENMAIAMGNAVQEKRIWHYLGEAGLDSIVLGVPQTYPVRPIKGNLVSGFLTPNQNCDFAYPPLLKKEVLKLIPGYSFDVKDFRTNEKDRLIEQIYKMTDQHFQLIDYMLDNKPWDFFMSVEIGVDRMHHAFWHCQDPEHPKYEKFNPYENSILEYYQYIDQKIGHWLSGLDQNTIILVVSDHGAQRMDGGLCVNEWLWKNGYLAFKKDPKPGQIKKIEEFEIDWSRTRAWGSGGYYGRIFMNVKGREPGGIILQTEYEKERIQLKETLEAIPDPYGKPMNTKIFFPDQIYRETKNIPPDMIVYFGNLYWRSVGSLGYDSWYTDENDTGPDSCNHAQNGIFILFDPSDIRKSQPRRRAHLMDITPTVLKKMNVRTPKDLGGIIIK
ncbi:alkaline phosphatase family protein [bacterium]|nr:alkaline phosphatase family protein [bacterium]